MPEMSDGRANQASQDVKIYPPDTSLQKKIGVDLDHVLTPQIVAAAQTVITQSVELFLEDSFLQMEELVKINTHIQAAPQAAIQWMPAMIDTAFSLKAEAGHAGYELVSALAKSLHLHCEQIKAKLSARDLNLIQWHVTSMGQLLRGKIKGDGGQIGQVILAELDRVHAGGLI